jgi:hypothetical protein
MDISIDYRTVLALDLDEEASISVARGRLWITRERDPRDYCVLPGERASLARGAWLVQALAPSRFRCEDVTRG